MASSGKQGGPMRVLVVDDEPLARRNLTILLSRDGDIGSIAECSSGAEAIEKILQWKPEIVFLDVQMPECGGFDVLEMLGADMPPAVIFVTAYDEYALKAFDAGALDYLLKPFDDARFARALERAKEKVAHTAPPMPQRLTVKSPGRLVFLNVGDIDWIEAASYYASLHVGDKTHLIRRTLAELERDLSPGSFVRIHRSHIVNLDRVHSIELESDGDYCVVLNSKVRLRLSRRYRKPLQDRMASMSKTEQ
jgi:two-component system LytT family response regulator